ncbi:10126_t:CDS:2, partial [Gigaspora rosea]
MFEKAALANNWKNGRKIEIVSGYLFEAAAYWYEDIKGFGTLEKKNKWHNELHNIKQGKDEHTGNCQVYSNERPPKPRGSHQIAEQLGAGKHYRKNKIERGRTQERRLEDDIDQLTQKMQQMSLSYASLTSALAAQETLGIRPPQRPRTSSHNEGAETVVLTTHSDDQPLDNNKESDGMEDLLEELKFEEEELKECETYYSEGWEVDEVEENNIEIYEGDNPSVFLMEVDPINPNDPKPLSHLSKEERAVMEKLLEDNETAFAENIAEEGQTLELRCTNLTYHEINTGTARPPKQLILLREQLLDAAQQKLLQRKIQKELDVDMGTKQRINLELHKVVNSLKNIKPEEEEEDAQVCLVNATYEPMLLISEELTPPNSDDKEKTITDENNDQLGSDEPDKTSVIVFELMSPRCRRRLVFVKACVDNGHEYHLYLHPTLGMHYAARRLDLRRAVYHLEFITFPLIANDPMDLITLQHWVTKGAQRAG